MNQAKLTGAQKSQLHELKQARGKARREWEGTLSWAGQRGWAGEAYERVAKRYEDAKEAVTTFRREHGIERKPPRPKPLSPEKARRVAVARVFRELARMLRTAAHELEKT